MTVETSIFSLLSSLVSSRVYPDTAPLSTPRPYITYQRIGGEAVTFVENTVPSMQNGVFQINLWSDTRMEASSIALAIESAFVTATAFQARPTGAPH